MLFSISFANKLFVLENIEKTNISNSSVEDIFGDEQTFPFVAGLGTVSYTHLTLPTTPYV